MRRNYQPLSSFDCYLTVMKDAYERLVDKEILPYPSRQFMTAPERDWRHNDIYEKVVTGLDNPELIENHLQLRQVGNKVTHSKRKRIA
jgi:hypothetical protein